MQTTFYKQPQATQLILYFAGWGTSPDLVRHYPLPADCDLLLCWDYRDLNFDVDITGYQQYHLVAWSMGVWAAEQVLPPLNFTHAIAINGTPLPMHDQFGIPTAIFKGTLENLTPTNLQKFIRRICGNAEFVAEYQKVSAPDFEQVQQELASIYQQLANSVEPHILWNKAIVADKDHIFPAQHQQQYWQQRGVKILSKNAPHFLFPLFESWQAIWQA